MFEAMFFRKFIFVIINIYAAIFLNNNERDIKIIERQ
jgi:hypothetical protein